MKKSETHIVREQLVSYWHAIVCDYESELTVLQAQALHSEILHLEFSFAGEALLHLAWSHFPKVGKVLDGILSGKPIEDRDDREYIKSGYWPFVSSTWGDILYHVENYGTGGFNPNLVAMLRQLLYFFKKFEVDCGKAAKVKAAAEFWDVDADLPYPFTQESDVPVEAWFLDEQYAAAGLPGKVVSVDEDYQAHRLDLHLLNCWQEISDWFASYIPYPTFDDLLPRHGPGAVSNLHSSGDKYTFPDYPQDIADVLPPSIFCQVNEAEWNAICHQLVKDKAPAKLIAVPKTFDKPRLIASEPVVHQYLQQALMRWLRANLHPLLRKVVAFTDQTPSQELALKASRTKKVATVDLSSASDRLSLAVVQCFFRTNPPILDLLVRTRSTHIVDGINTRNGVSIVRKFAAMGSAVTFPVQTLVYASCCFAAVCVARGWKTSSKKTSRSRLHQVAPDIQVFGDDIEIPVDAWQYLERLLELLGLKVNREKTHTSGHFRESCGMDAYRGFDVTPAYVSHVAPIQRRTPSQVVTFAAYIEQSNNAHRKGLWHLAEVMRSNLRRKTTWELPVSREDLGICSLFTYSRGTHAHKFRYNPGLMRYEVKGLRLFVSTAVEKREDSMDLLQYYIEGPSGERNHEDLVALLRSVGIHWSMPVELRPAWSDARCEST